MAGSLPACSRCKKDIISPVLGVKGLPLKNCLKCYVYLRNTNKAKRKEYNKKYYQKRKAKKAEEKERPKTEEKERPKTEEKEKQEIKENRLLKKSFTLNDKKFTLIGTPHKSHSALMASDRLLIRQIYNSYKAVKELYEEDDPPALASPALALLCDYLEEASKAHKRGVPWAINNHKEIKAHIEEIKEFLFNS